LDCPQLMLLCLLGFACRFYAFWMSPIGFLFSPHLWWNWTGIHLTFPFDLLSLMLAFTFPRSIPLCYPTWKKYPLGQSNWLLEEQIPGLIWPQFSSTQVLSTLFGLLFRLLFQKQTANKGNNMLCFLRIVQ
jgi:hypothetical protein